MGKREVLIIVLIFILMINIYHVNAKSFQDKVKNDVYDKLKKTNEIRVIIDLNNSNLNLSKENLLKKIDKKKLRHVFKDFISISVTKPELDNLIINPEVNDIILDKPIYALLQHSVPLINATTTWPLQENGINLTGAGETVCIIDTGINFSHPDLIGKNMTCTIDCLNEDCVPNCSMSDDHGHGTHVAGIVAANGNIKGVAIGAKLIGVKVLDSTGSGNWADLYSAIQWCTDNSETYNISVISMSLGDCTNHVTYCNNDGSASFINNAVKKNISVIISAGNGPRDSCSSSGITDTGGFASPACVENATAVGAVTDSDSIVYQRGTLFELMAPGVSINSTKMSSGYESRSGTSMAAPHVAGATAVLKQFYRLQNNKNMTSNQIKSVFNSTGKQLNDSGGTNLIFSRIDIYSAIISLDSVSPNITLNFPDDNTMNISQNLTFICNSSDLQLSNISLKIWNSSNDLVYNQTQNLTGEMNTSIFYVYNLSYSGLDYFKWNCIAYDKNGNSGYASYNYTLYINNISVILNSPMNRYYTNVSNNNFSCTSRSITNLSLINVTLIIWNSTNNIYYNSSSNISGILNTTNFSVDITKEDNYSYNCLAYNNITDSAFSTDNYSLVYDITKPITNSISVDDITTNSAVIRWNSNEYTNSTLDYGTNRTLGNISTNSTFILNHSLYLIGLTTSTSYYYNITDCDQALNCNTTGPYEFTTSANSIGISSTGSSGSSSASSSGSTGNSFNPNVKETNSGYTNRFSKGDIIKFIIYDNSEHSLTIKDIKPTLISVVIKSNTINLNLTVLDNIKLNITGPKYYDLELSLNSISYNKADLTVKTIFEKINKSDDKEIFAFNNSGSNQKNADIKSQEKPQDNNDLMLVISIILIILVIFILLIIILIIKKNHKRKHNKQNLKIKEYKEKFHKHINPREFRRM